MTPICIVTEGGRQSRKLEGKERWKMLSSSTRSFKLKNTLRHKVETVSQLFSSLERLKYRNENSLSESEIILAIHFAADLNHDIFLKNIQHMGLTDQKFLFEILNKYELWGPEAAVKFLLKDHFQFKLLTQDNQIGDQSEVFLNTILMITSPTLLENSKIERIKEAQKKKIPISKSWSIEGLMSYLKHKNEQIASDSLCYSLILLLHTQTKDTKVRFLFDLHDP